VLNILFTFRIFGQLVLALKNRFALKFFNPTGVAALPPPPMWITLWGQQSFWKKRRNMPREVFRFQHQEVPELSAEHSYYGDHHFAHICRSSLCQHGFRHCHVTRQGGVAASVSDEQRTSHRLDFLPKLMSLPLGWRHTCVIEIVSWQWRSHDALCFETMPEQVLLFRRRWMLRRVVLVHPPTCEQPIKTLVKRLHSQSQLSFTDLSTICVKLDSRTKIISTNRIHCWLKRCHGNASSFSNKEGIWSRTRQQI